MIKQFDTGRITISYPENSVYIRGTNLSIDCHYQIEIKDSIGIRIELAGSGRLIFKGSLTDLIHRLEEK